MSNLPTVAVADNGTNASAAAAFKCPDVTVTPLVPVSQSRIMVTSASDIRPSQQSNV